MTAVVPLQEYLDSISKLSGDADPTVETLHTATIKDAAGQLASLGAITTKSLTAWVAAHPKTSFVLGYAFGYEPGTAGEHDAATLRNDINFHRGDRQGPRLAV